jgi:hypothetical protein
MNRYIQIRRLRWPVVLLLIGVTALLHEMGIVDSWSKLFWPLLLILLGVFMLAERAALAADGDFPQYPGAYPGSYSGVPNPGAPAAPASVPTPAQTSTSIVPAPTFDLGQRTDGEQS